VFRIYNALLVLGLLLTSPWWILQMLRQGKYRAGLLERLGSVPSRLKTPPDGRKTLWIHAVSVGETVAAAGLIERLQGNERLRVVISTTTQTGQKLARERFGAENVFYFPLDLSFSIRRYLDALQPAAVVLLETEFWPNFLHRLSQRGIPVLTVNARISDRSLPRYLRFGWLFRPVLAGVACFAAQSKLDAERLRQIGAPPENVTVAGNLKFDAAPPAEGVAIVERLRTALSGRGPAIVAGSTVEGEEPAVIEAFAKVRQEFPAAVLLLAPRHKERFEEVARLLEGSGMPFFRRSRLAEETPISLPSGSVLLLDSLGELASLYSLGTLAIVGGGFARRGGHNILEPASFGVATLSGPHSENFRDIFTLFVREKAVAIAPMEKMGKALLELLRDEAGRRAMGERARQLVLAQRGATERTARLIEEKLSVEAGR
jgi:3-deoxy-D-manno-octulosonic-acid transferase